MLTMYHATYHEEAPLCSPGDHPSPPQVIIPLLPSPPQVIIRSSAKAAGHAWLREHLRSNYTAAWHEVRVRVRARAMVGVGVRVRVGVWG